MKFRKNEIYLLLLYILSFVSCKTVYEGIDTWSPELLYKYAKHNYLSSNNQQNISDINYMLVDPENYLKNANLSKIYNKMKLLYDKFNVSTYIILISHLQLNEDKKNSNMNSAIEKFTSYFNYMIYKDNYFYNDNYALTAAFFIKERKMRMRTGRLVKEIITDDEASNLLRKRKDDLRRENYFNVVNKLLDDIYKIYEDKVIYHRNHFDKDIGSLFLYIIFVIMMIICKCGCSNIKDLFFNRNSYHGYRSNSFISYENPKVKKIKEFLNKNKNKKIKNIFNETCIICLENLKKENEQLKREEEKTAILECEHKFHEKCIIKWLKKHNRCPICRREVKLDNGEIKNNFVNLNDRNEGLIYDRYYDQINFENEEIIEDNNNFYRLLWNIQNNIDARITIDFYRRDNDNRSNHSNHSNHSRSFDNFDSNAGGASDDW